MEWVLFHFTLPLVIRTPKQHLCGHQEGMEAQRTQDKQAPSAVLVTWSALSYRSNYWSFDVIGQKIKNKIYTLQAWVPQWAKLIPEINGDQIIQILDELPAPKWGLDQIGNHPGQLLGIAHKTSLGCRDGLGLRHLLFMERSDSIPCTTYGPCTPHKISPEEVHE